MKFKFSILVTLASLSSFIAQAQQDIKVDKVSKELISTVEQSGAVQDPNNNDDSSSAKEDTGTELSTPLIKVQASTPKDAATPLFPVTKKNNNVSNIKVAKVLTNDELLEKIKQTIKPVKIDESHKDISIQYGIPHLNLDKANADTSKFGKKLNLNVTNEISETTEFGELVSNAYKAALIGQLEASIVLYNKALEMQPDNLNVTYAIATLYHKLNQFDEAKDPNYRNALNNYLVVLAEESPSKALMEFKQLEKVNPNFSPVQAQIGMVYAKLGEYDMAVSYLKKAVMLSPELLNYRYNLAVLYDKMGLYNEAIALYRQLLAYESAGESLPASSEYLRSRVNYLVSKTNLHH